jgi:hypothetical protein
MDVAVPRLGNFRDFFFAGKTKKFGVVGAKMAIL